MARHGTVPALERAVPGLLTLPGHPAWAVPVLVRGHADDPTLLRLVLLLDDDPVELALPRARVAGERVVLEVEGLRLALATADLIGVPGGG